MRVPTEKYGLRIWVRWRVSKTYSTTSPENAGERGWMRKGSVS